MAEYKKENQTNTDVAAIPATQTITKDIAKRTVKDSLFCMLFREPKYALDLFQMIHPEVKDVSEKDIENLSTQSLFVRGIINDVGFTIKDKHFLFFEAQTTWNDNIIGRIYLYQAKFQLDYFAKHNEALHSAEIAFFPMPELYIYYEGDKQVPDVLSLKQTYFDGNGTFLECKAYVLKNIKHSTYLWQLKVFDARLNENYRVSGGKSMTREVIQITIDQCIRDGILKDFLLKHRYEVLDMLEGYWNEEEINRKLKEAEMEKVASENRAEGRVEGKAEERARMIHSLKNNGISEAQIAALLAIPIEEVRQILQKKRPS